MRSLPAVLALGILVLPAFVRPVQSEVPPPARAGESAGSAVGKPAGSGVGGDALDFKYMYYWDRNGVWDHTPALAYLKRLASDWSLKWQLELDAVSGASRRLGLRNVGRQGDNILVLDGISGASRREVRFSQKATVARHGREGRAAYGSFYTSFEDDYTSLAPSVGGAWDFNARNTTLAGEATLFFDDLEPRGGFTGMGGSRRIAVADLTLTQVLTRFSLAGITVSPILAEGYLGHPYNPVTLANGSLVLENLPDMKSSLAVAGRFIQGYRLGRWLGSARLEARYYRDTWELASGTADFQVYQYVSESAFFRLRARGYAQTPAAFAKERYDGSELYRTADIRFFGFSSLTLGLKIGAAFPASWGDSPALPDRWDLGYDHGIRDTRGEEGTGEPLYHYQLFPEDEYYQQGTFMLGLGFDL